MENDQHTSTNPPESTHQDNHATHLNQQPSDERSDHPLLIEAHAIWNNYLQQYEDNGSRSLTIPTKLVQHPPAIQYLKIALCNNEATRRPQSLLLTQAPPEEQPLLISSPEEKDSESSSSSTHRIKCLVDFLRLHRSHWKQFYLENDRSWSEPHVACILEEIAKAPFLEQCRLQGIRAAHVCRSLVGHRLGEIVQNNKLTSFHLEDCVLDNHAEKALLDAIRQRAGNHQTQEGSSQPLLLYDLALVNSPMSMSTLSQIQTPQWSSLNLASFRQVGLMTLADLLGHQTGLRRLVLSDNDSLFTHSFSSWRHMRRFLEALQRHENLESVLLDGCEVPHVFIGDLCESFFCGRKNQTGDQSNGSQQQSHLTRFMKVNDCILEASGDLLTVANVRSFSEMQSILNGLNSGFAKQRKPLCKRILFRECFVRGQALGASLGTFLSTLQGLTEVSFIVCQWTADTVEALSTSLQSCSTLQKLVWKNSEMQDSMIHAFLHSPRNVNGKSIGESGIWQLKALDLSGNNLGTPLLESLVLYLEQNQGLDLLDISGNRALLRGSYVRHFLITVSNHSCLRDLSLSFDQTDEAENDEDSISISALLQSIASSRLHILNLNQSHWIESEEEGWQSMLERLQHLQCLVLPNSVDALDLQSLHKNQNLTKIMSGTQPIRAAEPITRRNRLLKCAKEVSDTHGSLWPPILEHFCMNPSDATAAFSFLRSQNLTQNSLHQ